jgi:hypothetical protein
VIQANSVGLLDAVPPENQFKQINDIISAISVEAIEYHNVRPACWRARLIESGLGRRSWRAPA